MLPMMHVHKCRLAGLGLLLSTLLPVSAPAQTPDLVLKQTNPPALSDADRAKRDADKVSQWIRLVADKAAAKPAPAPAAAIAVPKKAGPAPVPTATPASPGNNSATLAAARKQIEATAEPAVAAAEPAPPLAGTDGGTRMALASQAAPAPVAAPPAAAAPPVEEPETPLKPLFQVQPEFPRQLINTLQSGMVAVRFTVRPDGTVSQAEAISSTHRRLSQAAIDAVKQWRFAPIKQERTAAVEVGFKLD